MPLLQKKALNVMAAQLPLGWCPHGRSTVVTGVYCGFVAGAPSGWTWLACAILLRAPFGRSEGNAGCPSIPENFLRRSYGRLRNRQRRYPVPDRREATESPAMGPG